MAYSFPLSLSQFFDLLPIREMTFELDEALEQDETGGGEILTASLGTRLWGGEVTLGDMTRAEVADVMAMMDIIRQSGASFMIHDRAFPGPRLDPTGAGLKSGDGTAVLHSVAANNTDIRIGGLHPDYQLRPHDYVAISYGADPVRFGLHRLSSGATADGDGLTPPVTVSPHLRPGWTAGAPVTLVRAACKAVYVPGSFQPGRRRGGLITGAGFKWRQTLR